MAFDPHSHKHRVMRDILAELQVEDAENDAFYSRGSTVTEAALRTAFEALKKYKADVRQLAQNIIDLE